VTFGALWCRFFSVVWRLQAADDQRLAAGFDDFLCDRAQVVDLHDALDLSEQTLDEAEVAAGDTGDGCELVQPALAHVAFVITRRPAVVTVCDGRSAKNARRGLVLAQASGRAVVLVSDS
jgi:hypothetical protein